MFDCLERFVKRHHNIGDDGSLPVMVPRSDKVLVPVAAARVRSLRKHLVTVLRELRAAAKSGDRALLQRPAPAGFAARVARTACSLC